MGPPGESRKSRREISRAEAAVEQDRLPTGGPLAAPRPMTVGPSLNEHLPGRSVRPSIQAARFRACRQTCRFANMKAIEGFPREDEQENS